MISFILIVAGIALGCFLIYCLFWILILAMA
jgi:hypothetical protein